MIRWLVAFAFTQAVEVPLWMAVLRRDRAEADHGSRASEALVAFGASALTHPIVWFVFPRALGWLGYAPMVAGAEAFAVVAEAVYMRAFGLRRALMWSLLINAVSAGVGFASRSLVGWP